MKDLSEFELYNADFKSLASDEDFDFYHEELVKIRKNNSGIIVAWIVPDRDEGHIEYKCFSTWQDAKIWLKQN